MAANSRHESVNLEQRGKNRQHSFAVAQILEPDAFFMSKHFCAELSVKEVSQSLAGVG
jgi:hypothetical protein